MLRHKDGAWTWLNVFNNRPSDTWQRLNPWADEQRLSVGEEKLISCLTSFWYEGGSFLYELGLNSCWQVIHLCGFHIELSHLSTSPFSEKITDSLALGRSLCVHGNYFTLSKYPRFLDLPKEKIVNLEFAMFASRTFFWLQLITCISKHWTYSPYPPALQVFVDNVGGWGGCSMHLQSPA